MMLTPHLRVSCWCALLVLGLGAPSSGQPEPASGPHGAPPGVLEVNVEGSNTRISLNGGIPFHVTAHEVKNERVVEVPGSPVRLVLWEERFPGNREVPFYAVSLDGQGGHVVRQTSYDVKLRHGDFDPLWQDKTVAPGLRSAVGCDMYIVQFVVQPLEAFRREIRVLGGTVYNYLPHHAHLVRMGPAIRQRVEALPYVRWVGRYHPAYRLEEPLRDALRGQGEPLQRHRYRIQVFEKGRVHQDRVADRITAMGGTIHVLSESGFVMEATLTPEQLVEVARMNEVLFIDRWSAPRAYMNNVRIVGGANYVESVAGYTGAGVRGEIMDNGCQTSHPDFAGRITVRGDPVNVESHGTATFGIVFGSGAGSATARGMMPDAFGYFNDWSFSGSRYDDIGQLVTSPYDCVFQSNSWGFQSTSQYTTITAEMDRAIFDFDIVVLHSQGNEGTQASVEHAWGKNIVGVGGVMHFNDANTANDAWSGTGSIGPAEDGRIKPDLCYYYDSIRTTAPNSSYTNGFGGTSAACPETAGHFGLMFQMWADGIFGNPVSGGSVFAERPHSSTARALLVNTANQYPFSGTTHDLTRTHQGWGLADVGNLYDLRENMLIIDETEVLSNFQTAEYSILVVAGEPALRATLIYTDAPGTTSASQHRINDLTLKVTSPSSVVYYGNNGLLSGNWSTPGGLPNTIDTVENVFIENPEGGVWTIRVTAYAINVDGHVETPEVDADFGLVVSGMTPDCNTNGIGDALDIASGTSADCNDNRIPDECEPDCNTNSVADDCDIDAGTSADCNSSGVPDECEPQEDCQSNGVQDICDVAAGTSLDCNGNEVPDECEADCNTNGLPDECDITDGISNDCQPNGIPDECETDCNDNRIADECDLAACVSADCNSNGIPDECDLGVGVSQDCNSNGVPDECDIARCYSVWDGFPQNDPPDPFYGNQPLGEVDYNGDGIYWDNPVGNAVIGLFGCETDPPDPFDLSVSVSVPTSGDPEDGYVASEYFRTVGGELECEGTVYSLAFNPQVQGVYGDPAFNHKYDWEYFIYDARRGARVIQIEFASTESTLVVPSQRGKILVRNPAGTPAYLDTGVELLFEFDPVSFQTGTPCYDFDVVLDNMDNSVKLYIDGELRVETTPLDSEARRMDYFRLQPVRNFATTEGDTSFRLDRFDLCLTGTAAAAAAVYDCNSNGTLDACDLTAGVSVDCQGDGIPDECQVFGDFDGDEDVDLTDYATFSDCMTGPNGGPVDAGCALGDFDCDGDLDLNDFAAFQEAFAGSL